MTARPYKKAFSREKAAEIIRSKKKQQLDPDVIERFLAHKDDFDMILRKMQNEELNNLDQEQKPD